MWTKSKNPKAFGVPAIQFRAHAGDCKVCSFRRRCLGKEDQKTPRTFVWFKTNDPDHQPYTKRMIKKIDTEEGRREYSKRLGAIEPVFANITSNLGLKWFSLRGKLKVSAQWKLFCIQWHHRYIYLGYVKQQESIPRRRSQQYERSWRMVRWPQWPKST